MIFEMIERRFPFDVEIGPGEGAEKEFQSNKRGMNSTDCHLIE